jgi:hypothetical protein
MTNDSDGTNVPRGLITFTRHGVATITWKWPSSAVPAAVNSSPAHRPRHPRGIEAPPGIDEMVRWSCRIRVT